MLILLNLMLMPFLVASAWFRSWCRKDPKIRIRKPNGDWYEGNVGGEVYGEDDFSWENGDTYITVTVPDETIGWKYRDHDVLAWHDAALDTWYDAGTPWATSYHEYIKFVADPALNIDNGKITFTVSTQMSSRDGTLEMRHWSNPKGEPTKVSNPTGTVASPPAPLQDKLTTQP